jgi:hypothetical protein
LLAAAARLLSETSFPRGKFRLDLPTGVSIVKKLPNTTASSDASIFREEAERARRYAAAMTDKKVIDRLNQIAALYEELAAGQDLGPADRD